MTFGMKTAIDDVIMLVETRHLGAMRQHTAEYNRSVAVTRPLLGFVGGNMKFPVMMKSCEDGSPYYTTRDAHYLKTTR